MRLLRNPWFIAVAGAAAMAAYGALVSPVSMLVLGTPWYLGALLYVLMERSNGFGIGAVAPGRSSTLVFYVAAGLAAAAFAYLVWGRMTDTGLIGWFDAVQARGDGRYSPKLSFVVGILYVCEFFLLFLLGEQWLTGRRRAPARPAARVLP